jgi:hypothetical protein
MIAATVEELTPLIGTRPACRRKNEDRAPQQPIAASFGAVPRYRGF